MSSLRWRNHADIACSLELGKRVVGCVARCVGSHTNPLDRTLAGGHGFDVTRKSGAFDFAHKLPRGRGIGKRRHLDHEAVGVGLARFGGEVFGFIRALFGGSFRCQGRRRHLGRGRLAGRRRRLGALAKHPAFGVTDAASSRRRFLGY